MGLYAPMIKGEKEGMKIGLDSDLDLWQITKGFDYEKLEGEWLLGYGVGFVKGQCLRNKIRRSTSKVTFSESIRSVLVFHEMHCYNIFVSSIDSYIEHIDNWNCKKMTCIVEQEIQALLELNKLQQALHTLADYYKNNFVLNVVFDFDRISKQLKQLRRSKQYKQISTKQYLDGKSKILIDLKHWLVNYGEQ